MLENRNPFIVFNQEAKMEALSPVLAEELIEVDLSIQGGCTTNTFTLSNYLGNNGGWCTLTKECQRSCN
ncbi:plantaricin C family lantibiotic [Paenibacillus sp. YPG26]|uniref:plantaricin C family lantibiotic n=1 Tax=Paenibacillus sp. YPG26 TaxID=2878915 RepID=UPI00203EB899|nr:plantaricin C family lantibiotic [Paenibacillus sp. YPG26]USB33639.1 plantaricin C family lantibiotic [Paenibacillus sp. YPG26]